LPGGRTRVTVRTIPHNRRVAILQFSELVALANEKGGIKMMTLDPTSVVASALCVEDSDADYERFRTKLLEQFVIQNRQYGSERTGIRIWVGSDERVFKPNYDAFLIFSRVQSTLREPPRVIKAIDSSEATTRRFLHTIMKLTITSQREASPTYTIAVHRAFERISALRTNTPATLNSKHDTIYRLVDAVLRSTLTYGVVEIDVTKMGSSTIKLYITIISFALAESFAIFSGFSNFEHHQLLQKIINTGAAKKTPSTAPRIWIGNALPSKTSQFDAVLYMNQSAVRSTHTTA
jgi:hypothetical protein